MSLRIWKRLVSGMFLAGAALLAPTFATAQECPNLNPCSTCNPQCNPCSECNQCCNSWSLGDLLLPSDECYKDFISPMTNPVFFEDPRMLTEARLIYLNHTLPGTLGGGDADLVALQLRARLTDRLSLIATKDGFIMYGSDVPVADDGWADVALGLKYLLYADPETQTLLSGGLTFELPVGSTRALQGNGDGEFNLFLTGGTQLGQSWHYLTTTGLRLPSDTQSENQVFYWSQHLDYQFVPTWYAFGELNWYHYMSDTTAGGVPGINGLDLYNLGSSGVAGNNIVTAAYGLKKRFGNYNEIGVAYELPVTSDEDLLHSRFTVDMIFRY